ncbi:MAG: alpha/beta hydrolase fold domain-containing protein [Planctomycetota bacterium]|jgi:acetyl esterase/lipase
MRILIVVLTFAIGVPAIAQNNKNAPKLPKGVTLTRDIQYGNPGGHALTLDLYLPKKKGAPLAVWVHGGGWKKGSKNSTRIGFLLEKGYAVASVEYRLTDVATWPANIHDIKGAIRFLRANADRYGYDARRIGVAGSSAGGHLVALLGTSGGVPELEGTVGGNLHESSRVQAVVDYFGPTDLYRNATLEQDRCDLPDSPLYLYMGGKPSERLEMTKLASPVYHVTKDDPPVMIFQGTHDELVDSYHSYRLHELYLKAGLKSDLKIVYEAGHGGPLIFNDQENQRVLRFFNRHIKNAK